MVGFAGRGVFKWGGWALVSAVCAGPACGGTVRLESTRGKYCERADDCGQPLQCVEHVCQDPGGGGAPGAGGVGLSAGGAVSVGGAPCLICAGGAGPGPGVGGSSMGTAGGVGVGGSSSAGSPSVCDGARSFVLTSFDTFVEDFESPNANPQSMMLQPDLLSPAWFAFNDTQPPNSVRAERVKSGATGTGYAAHYYGNRAKPVHDGGYGVGLEYNVGLNQAANQYCVDVSAFRGISFWAKAGSPATTLISLGFVVPAQNAVLFGGDCPDAEPAKCNHFPTRDAPLSPEWARYAMPFNEFKGDTGATIAKGRVQQLLWLTPTADWDFWIDEIAFYVDTPAPGPVAAPK